MTYNEIKLTEDQIKQLFNDPKIQEKINKIFIELLVGLEKEVHLEVFVIYLFILLLLLCQLVYINFPLLYNTLKTS
jgi:hypothetical protein